MVAPALQESRDPGCLPAWERADLPEPLPFTLRNVMRTIGPGAILLAAAIGGGEWIVGPIVVVRHGSELLWIATASILLQSLFNLEGCRYTLATGEPIFTGFMRLRPGPATWAVVYGALGTAQLAIPALAKASAAVLFAACAGRLPEEADDPTVTLIAGAVIGLGVVLLLSGKSIERALERVSWGMILFIFGYLLLVNVLFVPAEVWSRNLRGLIMPAAIPPNIEVTLLATFAATAGAGGLGNLVISNWFRDKGLGMGSRIGHIGGLAETDAPLRPVGFTFPSDAQNQRRWRGWWSYAVADQSILWAGGCALGMLLNVNLAAATIPPGESITGFAAGTFQAKYMAEHAWQGFWALTLINGFWILFSTHLGNTDCLVRTLCDIAWAGAPRLRRWSIGRLYAATLLVLTAGGLVSIHFGNVLQLFTVLGVVASPIMALGAVQILRVNRRFLPTAARPPLWREAALLLCSIVYSAITALVVWEMIVDR